MTTLSKQSLTALFETGDVPSGTDFANLIDSQINVAETSVQSMIGAINPTELITARVSATNVNVTGTLSVSTFSAANLSTNTFTTSALSVTGIVSAASMNASTDIIAGATITASATRTGLLYSTPIIISAAGTALSTAAILTGGTNRVQGVADGQTTGVKIPVDRVGLEQYVINETTVSANLWPAGADYKINALNSGAAFPMAANTLYTIVQTTNSAAYVK